MVILFYFNFYCYYITCPNFSPFALLHLAHLTLLQSIPTPLSMSMGHSYMFFDQSLPLLSTIILLPCPCHSVPCFHASGSTLLIILFIRFLLKVRSYGIFLSLTCLQHFTQHNIPNFYLCCRTMQEFLLSFCCIVFHCVNVPQFFDQFIY